jgi:hypothetical protein
MAKGTTLYTPDGRSYVTSDPTEITRLKAQGYSETDPNKKTSTSSTSSSSKQS